VISVISFITYVKMEADERNAGRLRQIFSEPVYKFSFKKCFSPRLKPVPLPPLNMQEGDGKLITIP
jgi:hypothetical protein